MAETFDLVTVTAQAAPGGSSGGSSAALVSETFPGANGAAWPAGWTILTAGGATAAQATQQNARGRMALPGSVGYPAIAAVRRDVVVADLDVLVDVHGSFDTTSAATAEHYREVHVRVPTTRNPATQVEDSLFLSIFPSSSDVATRPWYVILYRRRGGVTTELARDRTFGPAVRSFRVRLRTAGRLTQVRAWEPTATEPSTWMFEHTDAAPEAILTAGNVALVGVGSSTANSGVTVEWDNVTVTSSVAAPTVSASGPTTSVFNDPIPLSAQVSGATSLLWSVVSGPRGAGGSFADPTAANTTFTPATAGGTYVFRLTATNFSASASAQVSTEVFAQLWKKTPTGKVPLRIDVKTSSTTPTPVSGAVYRGINLPGAEFGLSAPQMPGVHGQDYLWPSQQDFDYLASRGHKMVRLPFRWERMQRTLGGPLDATELGRLKTALSQALSVGMKVMFGPHNFAEYLVAPSTTLRIGDGTLTQAHFVDFWTKLAAEVKGHPAVLGYGLMNEPRELAATSGTFTASATVFNFDALTQGWVGDGSTVARSTSVSRDGGASLSVTRTVPAGQAILRANDGAANTLTAAGGKTLRAWLLIPAGTSGTWTGRLEVQNNVFGWQYGPELALTPGVWTEVTYTPSDGLWAEAPNPIGVQLTGEGVSAGAVTAYVDTVRQGNSVGVRTPAQVWEDASLAAGQAIRGTGASEIIFAPGYNYSGAQQWTVQHATPWMTGVANVFYEAHYYFDRDNSGDYPDTYAAENADAVARGYANLQARALAELKVFTDWCTQYGVKGFVGEIGWTRSGGDLASWNAVGEALYDHLDSVGMGAAGWAAAQWFGLTYNLSIYTGTNINSGLSQTTGISPVFEAHPSIGVGGEVVAPPSTSTSLSRNKPVTTSTAVSGSGATLVDGNTSNGTFRSSGYPAEVVIDLQVAGGVVVVGHGSDNYLADSAVTAGPTYNEIGDYSYASSPDGSTWTPRQTVTGNTRRARTARLDLGSHTRLRLRATAGNPKNDAQNVDAVLAYVEVGSNLLDTWLAHSDSIGTESMRATRNITGRVTAINSARQPVLEALGWPGLGIAQAAVPGAARTAYLKTLDETAARQMLLAFGSNDYQMTPDVFEGYVRAVCNDALARGITPHLLTIPSSPDAARRTGVVALNARLASVVASSDGRVKAGPDRFAMYDATLSLISADQLHPTEAGYVAEAQLIAQYIAGASLTSAPIGGQVATTYVRHGISPGYTIIDRSSADQDFELDKVQRVANGKPTVIRIDSTPGNQAKMDLLMPKVLQRGLVPMLILWGSEGSPPAVGTFAASQVTKWGAAVSLYEIVNEPDMRNGAWTADGYADFVKAVATQMRAAPGWNSNKRIIAGALFNGKAAENTVSALTPDAFARSLIARANGFFDAFSMHLYENPLTRAGWNGWDRAVPSIRGTPTWYSQTRTGGNWTGDVTVRTLLNNAGLSHIPILSTENGRRLRSDQPGGHPEGNATEAEQAATVGLDFDMVAEGVLTMQLVYAMMNDSVVGFGILRDDRSERPAFTTFRSRAST